MLAIDNTLTSLEHILTILALKTQRVPYSSVQFCLHLLEQLLSI